ncbi:MAG: radical SAM protein [bacterium]|nr:radical SAM protein [bacterium]
MSAKIRDYCFHATGTGLCPHCLTAIPAKIIIKNGSVYLRKRCPQHGTMESLLEENAAWYQKRLLFNKPGTATTPQTEIQQGCPHDCGLCPDHDQHTCIGLIEITRNCPMQCPLCYADSNPSADFLHLKHIKKMIDFFVASEDGNAEILQISGGEPCTHPHIINIIEAARSRGVKYVMLNTNGSRMAEDIDFVKELTRFESGFEVYLQFDGFKKETHMQLRGNDLRQMKLEAIANLTKYGVPVTLVPTIIKGINDDEIGGIVDFGLKTACISGYIITIHLWLRGFIKKYAIPFMPR